MSRYIKFDDAVKIMACEMYAEAQSQGYDVDGIEDFMPEAKAWITDAPSIDIVRCRECKYWQPHEQYGYDEDNNEYHDYCRLLVPEDEYYAFRRKPDDFCSYGERSK